MHTIHAQVLVRRVLLAVGLALLLLVLTAGRTHADDPVRQNCPTGFVWIRMSGTACVQEQVPPNGKIGYDGHGVCIEPYVGIYEFRPTTDGKPPPGAPYTSFSYLLECLTQDQYASRVAAGPVPSPGAVAAFLADHTTLPPAGDLVVIGMTAAGTLLVAAAAAGSLRPASPVAPGSPEAALAVDRAAVDAAVPLRQRLAELDRINADLTALRDRIAAFTDPSTVRIDDVLEVIGDISGIVAAATVAVPAVSLPAGLVSLLGTSLSLAQGGSSTDELLDQARSRLGDLEFLHGRIEADRAALAAQLALPPPPSESPPPDPASLSDDDLRAARDDAQRLALEAHDRALEGLDRASGLRRQDDDRVRQIDAIRAGALVGGDTVAPGAASVAAGLESLLGDTGSAGFSRSAAEAGTALHEWRQTEGLLGPARTAPLVGGASRTDGLSATIDGVTTGRTAAGIADKVGKGATVVGGAANAYALYEWYLARAAEGSRAADQLAIAGHQFERGRLADAIDRANADVQASQQAADAAASRRRALSAEIDGRAAARGHLLWPPE